MQSYIVVGQTVAIEQTLDADVPDDVNLVESHGRFHYLRPVQVDGLVSDSDHVRFHFSGPNGCRLEFSGQQSDSEAAEEKFWFFLGEKPLKHVVLNF